jgi:hypothetical protein
MWNIDIEMKHTVDNLTNENIFVPKILHESIKIVKYEIHNDSNLLDTKNTIKNSKI